MTIVFNLARSFGVTTKWFYCKSLSISLALTLSLPLSASTHALQTFHTATNLAAKSKPSSELGQRLHMSSSSTAAAAGIDPKAKYAANTVSQRASMAKTAGGALNMHVIPSQSRSQSHCPSHGSKCVRGGGGVINFATTFETNTEGERERERESNGHDRMRKRHLVIGFLPVRWMRSSRPLPTHHTRWYFNFRQTVVSWSQKLTLCWLFCNDFITQPETSNVTDCLFGFYRYPKAKDPYIYTVHTAWNSP